MPPLAQGHETITLALITLIPLFLFYGFVHSFLLPLIPLIILLFSFHLYFFRDPDRTAVSDSQYILAPADGKIYEIDTESGIIRIRMSLFNVHVTRAPVSGKIIKITRQPGSYWPFIPFLRKGTKANARQIIYLQNNEGIFQIVQIVGALARRCTCYFSTGDQITQGERIGMIFYGSEVDIELPLNKIDILVKKGEKTVAGITPVAKLIEKTK